MRFRKLSAGIYSWGGPVFDASDHTHSLLLLSGFAVFFCCLAESQNIMALLWRQLKAVQVFGANTDVGKTIFTTLLCQTAKQHWRDDNVTFVKPVSTGSDLEADEAYVSITLNKLKGYKLSRWQPYSTLHIWRQL